MSIRNGDKARTNTQRNKRNARRIKLRGMRAEAANKTAGSEKKSSKK